MLKVALSGQKCSRNSRPPSLFHLSGCAVKAADELVEQVSSLQAHRVADLRGAVDCPVLVDATTWRSDRVLQREQSNTSLPPEYPVGLVVSQLRLQAGKDR